VPFLRAASFTDFTKMIGCLRRCLQVSFYGGIFNLDEFTEKALLKQAYY
jgi:hypothetical protein